jgi:hypothetical protein
MIRFLFVLGVLANSVHPVDFGASVYRHDPACAPRDSLRLRAADAASGCGRLLSTDRLPPPADAART